MRAALFFMLGLTILLGVVGGIENTIDIDGMSAFQFVGVTLIGIAMMALGVSYAEEQ